MTGAAPPGLITARIVRVDRNAFVADVGGRECRAALRGGGGFPPAERGRGRGSARGRAAAEGVLRPVVGDLVRIVERGEEVAEILEILPRATKLARRAAGPEVREQVVVANVSRLVVVVACRSPDANLFLVDRLLVAAETGGLAAAVILNKVDLLPPGERAPLHAEAQLYERLGYPVRFASARTGEGLEEVAALFRDRVSVVSGPSGAGKSSLLNRIEPGLALKTSEVQKHGGGRHTTTHVSLLRLSIGGYVADTPGIRAFGLWEVTGETLGSCFPEIFPLQDHCKFKNCLHVVEPGCAVRAGLASSLVHPRRYESYKRMLASLGEDEA